jgi:hypothetical protein
MTKLRPPFTQEHELHYRKLDAIDAKCGALLAVTSILLVFASMPPVFEMARAGHPLGFKMVFIALLVSCMISLVVLFFKEETSDRFVEGRKYALNAAVCITATCCLYMTLLIGSVL